MRRYNVNIVAKKTNHPFKEQTINITGTYKAKTVKDLLTYLEEEYNYTYIESMNVTVDKSSF